MKPLIVVLTLTLILSSLPGNAQGDDSPILPLNLEPITANNIHRLERLAVLGFGNVQNLNWSPDGYTLAIEGTNGLWAYSMADFSRPRLLPDAEIETWMLEGHQRLNNDELAGYRELTDADSFSVALSSDNTLLAEVDSEAIRVWSVQNKQVLAVIPADGDDYANGLTFSQDAEHLAAGFFDEIDQGSCTKIVVWDVHGGQEIAVLRGEHFGAISQIAFDPTGKLLASVDISDTLNVWDLATGELAMSLSGHAYGTPSLTFSPDGMLLASVGGLSDVILWDVMAGRQVQVLRPEPRIMGHELQFIDPETLYVTGVCGPLYGWDISTGEQTIQLNCKGSHKDGKTAFSPDGRLIVGVNEFSPIIDVWDVATDTLITELTGHDEWVVSTAFSPDGTLLASGSIDGTIRLWNTTTWEEETVITQLQGSVCSLVFSPDSHFLVSASGDGTARLLYVGSRDWDTLAGTQMAILYNNRQQDDIFVFSPGERLLVTGACQTIYLDGRERKCSLVFWDVASVQPVRVIQMEEDWLTVAFNPDSTLLAIGTTWGGIELWGVPGT